MGKLAAEQIVCPRCPCCSLQIEVYSFFSFSSASLGTSFLLAGREPYLVVPCAARSKTTSIPRDHGGPRPFLFFFICVLR